MRMRPRTRSALAKTLIFFISSALGLVYVTLTGPNFQSASNSLVKESPVAAVHRTDRRIFFHEVSGRSILAWRELCSLEAAARYNPARPVQLFVSSDFINTTHPWFDVVSTFPNVDVILIDNAEYFKGTPLEEWHERKAWRFSEFEVPHLAQFIRLVTLYKGGGQYLDLDMLLFKALDENLFRDYFAFAAPVNDVVDGAAFHLSKNHPMIAKLMRYLSEHYDASKDIFHGSNALTNVLESHCKNDLNSCADVKVLPHSLLYPVHRLDSVFLERNVSKEEEMAIEKGYGIHLYHSFLAESHVDSHALFARLAIKHCPLTLEKVIEFNGSML